jgi:hypothetical protein
MDMGSEYSIMKDYLDSLSNQKIYVHRLKNIGPRQLWSSDVFRSCVGDRGFFLTDGDIDFSESHPDVLQKLISTSEKYKYFKKVGCALALNKLPDKLDKSRLIFESEGDNWSKYRLIDRDTYLAPIDTTIAYYPRYTNDFFHWPAIRVAGEYSVIHTPWHVDYANLNEEEKFYIDSAKGWGGFGTSSERGTRDEDLDFRKTKLYLFRVIVKSILKLQPKIGSMVISKLIRMNNHDSKIDL